MDMKTAVFGDRFKHYAQLVDGITYGELLAILKKGALTDEVYELCQGVSHEGVATLQQYFSELGKLDQLQWQPDQQAVERQWVHKTQQSNVLISEPLAATSERFDMNLVIDQNNEMLLDHLSGFHVQGMVLIEAARQAFLAVTERHLLPKQGQYYFIIERFDVEYFEFIFPVSCGMVFQLTHQQDKSYRQNFEADIQFWQNGRLCTQAQVKYAVYDAASLSLKEQALAIAARQKQVQEAAGAFSA